MVFALVPFLLTFLYLSINRVTPDVETTSWFTFMSGYIIYRIDHVIYAEGLGLLCISFLSRVLGRPC